MKNFDKKTVDDFGKEWNRFRQDDNILETKKIFKDYFSIFPFDKLNKNSVGFDAGCGSGRWSKYFVKIVKHLDCIEPSTDALNVAKSKLEKYKNINFINQTIDEYFSNTNTKYDFGFSLGVLHHIPNIKSALTKINNKLKNNAPFLIYVYYNFENRSFLFQSIWFLSNILRILISKLPNKIKFILCDIIALIIYLPLSILNKYLYKTGIKFELPLYYYRDKSFYTMRTDALDRFGTRLEKRFSKKQIENLLKDTGFVNIIFSKNKPYWVILCSKK